MIWMGTRSRGGSKFMVLGLLAGVGLAVSSAAASMEPPNAPADDAPLSGPAVKDRKVPGVADRFGDMAEGKRGMADRIPPRAMRGAIMRALGEDAPEELRLSDAQRDAIKGHMQAYGQELRGFADQHRAEIDEIRAAIPNGAMHGPGAEVLRRLDEARGDGKDGAKDHRGAEPRRREHDRGPEGGPEQGAGKARKAAAEIPVETREKLRELAAAMPPFEQVYTKIWAELRPEQQRAVDERLQEFRDRMSHEREQSYVNKRLGAKRGPAAGPEGAPPRRRPADGVRIEPREDGARHERMMRAFERLSPEQQEQVMRRIEGLARGDQGGPNADRRGRGKRGEAKPMPPEPPSPPPEAMDGEPGRP